MFLEKSLTTKNPRLYHHIYPLVSLESPCISTFIIKLLEHFCQCIVQKEYWKTIPRKFGLFTGKVTINYLNLVLVKAFLELLTHITYGGSISSENYGTSSLWLNFHCNKALLFDKGLRNALVNRSILRK